MPLPNNQLRVIYPDVPDNYRTRLDAQWPIHTGGRVEALIAAAQLDASAAGDDVETLRSDLRFEIARAYWSQKSCRVLASKPAPRPQVRTPRRKS